MELDNMKDIWRGQKSGAQNPLNEQELMAMISSPSKSPIATMKRNLKKELIVVLVSFSLAALRWLFRFEGRMVEISLAYIFLLLAFVVYYFFKNRVLSNMQCIACEVKSNLSMQVSTLEKYIKNNLIASTLLLPVFLMFAAWVMHAKFYSETPRFILSYSVAYPEWITTLAWAGLSIALTIPMYFLNKKYLHWLYGKHINRLKRLLSEIDSE